MSRFAGDREYLKILKEMEELHKRKAADYGSDKDPLANIRASEEVGVEAWRGAWLRAKDKVKRIDAFCIHGHLANEGVEDSFIDLAAYAIIALRLFREKKSPPAQLRSSKEAHERERSRGLAGPRLGSILRRKDEDE